ncbi:MULTISPECIES: dTDP-4-dehydrorhamnose 3,5-epimerase [unclassified Halomonas]|uniref:dTDP-4-dehydrorhamnose 3,5-epimerase n=1 Tax=unclassified Halomonas TaxID=2609666 RepID=UPI001C94B351|nr:MULTISPECIES: dTDP-4-dehydrorhamnose 3,5-epimerase [unclassified Halomonas]MBY5924891.1 dTDP-4-dehydrorhamnose 3,5-epimerase [Halomonas sp. DP4Y7-2]MBY6231933.1 dTDP-4-dehydrorhamnose 3,5-epimerase [Halomonas sp. DP4Y7-1]
MRVIETPIPDLLEMAPTVHGDARGFFMESFNQRDFEAATGTTPTFVQDNHSRSRQGVLRGLHYQVHQPQGKLVRVIHGEILDVAVDIRTGSATFGHWHSVRLSADNQRQLWVPKGFAHGFLVLSDVAEVLYKTTDYYAPEHERSLRWDDPLLAIDWQRDSWQWGDVPLLSDKDRQAGDFAALIKIGPSISTFSEKTDS